MANGDDKNWMRICIAVDGFRTRYGRWPTCVRLSPTYFEDVVGHILSPIGFALVSSIFAITPDQELSEEVAIIATGERGTEFRYGDDGREPELRTLDYFGQAVLRDNLGSGLESVSVYDAEGNLVWSGEGDQEPTTKPQAADEAGAGVPAMSSFWDRVRRLEGLTLTTLYQDKPFRVVAVLDDAVRVLPQDGSGAERSVRRDRIEHIAGMGLTREELRGRVAQEYPDSQNTSYIAALVFAVADPDGGAALRLSVDPNQRQAVNRSDVTISDNKSTPVGSWAFGLLQQLKDCHRA